MLKYGWTTRHWLSRFSWDQSCTLNDLLNRIPRYSQRTIPKLVHFLQQQRSAQIYTDSDRTIWTTERWLSPDLRSVNSILFSLISKTVFTFFFLRSIFLSIFRDTWMDYSTLAQSLHLRSILHFNWSLNPHYSQRTLPPAIRSVSSLTRIALEILQGVDSRHSCLYPSLFSLISNSLNPNLFLRSIFFSLFLGTSHCRRYSQRYQILTNFVHQLTLDGLI